MRLPASLGLLFALSFGAYAAAQQAPPPADLSDTAPMPDIPALLHEVEVHERASEAAQKDYLYQVSTTEQSLDSHGNVKKTTSLVADSFTVDGIRVNRVTERNGKPLTFGEQKKEIDRVDKEIDQARERRRKAESKSKDVDPNGNQEITVSRFLELGAFTHPRRELRDGRPTLAVDFTGDPKAKSRNEGESLIRDLAGTVWIDEQDRAIVRIEGHAVDDFRVSAGLLVSLKKGTTFSLQKTKINNEVWLPAELAGHGSLRYLLFFGFSGDIRISCTGYRKFQASSTVLPDLHIIAPEDPPANPAPQPPQP